jgi:carbamoyl-phosphate synthase large subunit
MEHIEEAGVHSGDSACVIPPVNIAPAHLRTIEEYTAKIALALGVVGLLNVQFAIADSVVYVLEANPRASRTVPLVSKICGLSLARRATQVMLGASIESLGLRPPAVPYFGVKEAVFPFNMFPEVDPVLGPEMRSTGEVLGVADDFGLAFFKAQEATQSRLPVEGTVLITVADPDKPLALVAARAFKELGFRILATRGTHEYLAREGVSCDVVKKVQEGRPNIPDAIANGEIQLVVNTPIGKLGKHDDSYIRKAAIRHKVPYVTTMEAALITARGIARRAAAAGRHAELPAGAPRAAR